MTSHAVVLAGDGNAVLDPDIDHIGERSGTNNPDVKLFQDFIDGFDKYQNEHSCQIV